MSMMLADIDATCASLGYYDGSKYIPEPDALQGLKHLIWILRRDGETHEYRRHLGSSKVMESDLLPMMIHQSEENEMSDVLLRLLVNLTSPTLLLYNEILPKDGPNRRNFLYLVEILQTYKSAFSTSTLWAVLFKRLQTVLEIDPMERTEEKGLLIERALVLIRNILNVPSSPNAECRTDNDASLHDQVLWSLQQAGILDLILYIVGSEHENQYHFHALEIICLIYREQKVESLATVSLQRSATEKHLDERELISARKRESAKIAAKPPPGRHSRFGGTYTIRNVKSVSNRDIICHQNLNKAVSIDFDSDKTKQKQSFRVAKDHASVERRSAFSIRLFLRQFAVEVLRSTLNSLIRQVRRTLERNSFGHDDSYLLWAIKFFLEFNRKSSFELALVSEAMNTTTFHWVVARIQHHSDMLTSDKKNVRLWQRRLHIAVQAFKELLLSLVTLQKIHDADAAALFKMLLNNVCYVHEFRETVFHILASYNENQNTKLYLRDVVEIAHIFFKLLERFCNGGIIVQTKELKRRRKKSKTQKKNADKQKASNNEIGASEDCWADLSPQISSLLSMDKLDLPEDEHPLPFDAALDVPLDEQKDTCMVRLHNLLTKQKLEQAIILLRSAREIWPGSDGFGTSDARAEDELWLLRNIFMSKLGPDNSERNEREDEPSENESDEDEDEEEEIDRRVNTETELKFDDFIKRLVNPKIVRACTVVLSDWEALPAETIKSAVTILYRIAFVAKMPMMLCQMSLFRTFQNVLNTPKDKQYDEIRRLANYVVRQFVEVAVKNPKIYAELLFYKNIREANDIESGYTDDGNDIGHKKSGWTEEQEDELRQLYQENQENPSTEQDVIDWILNNLIEKNRTRRAVIKKLKEMNLIFKAPTRKSLHAGVPKNLWRYEEDTQLKELYETNRLNENCLAEIMQVFNDKRSKNMVIKRMITLGLIADRSEIQPNKRKRSKSMPMNDESSADSDDDSENYDNESNGYNKRSVKDNSKNKQSETRSSKLHNVARAQIVTDVVKARHIMSNLSEQNKMQLAWIVESLNDAAEDIDADESDSDDLDDGIPLVPFQIAQKEALKTPEIEDLLSAIGLQKPTKEMETYWRIPISLNASEIRERSKLLAGDLDAISETAHAYEKNCSDPSDDEISTDRLKQHARLIYSNSDEENDTLVAESNQNEEHSRRSTPDITIDRRDGNENPITDVFDSEDFNSQSIRQRLAVLEDSEPMDDAVELNSKPNKRNRFSMTGNDSLSGSDDDDINLITSFRKKKAKLLDYDDDDE